jgi:hypothetical protein
MHGRFFAGTQVEAFIATGKEKFSKSGGKKDFGEENEVQEGEEIGGAEEIR